MTEKFYSVTLKDDSNLRRSLWTIFLFLINLKYMVPWCTPYINIWSKQTPSLSFSTLSKHKYVATTADAWSAAGNSYLGVTCHWIDPDSRVRKSCVLACSLMEEKHTGQYIAQMLDKIQTKFKIQGSVVRTTTDNGANFVSSFKLFGQCNDANVKSKQLSLFLLSNFMYCVKSRPN